jgi:hypothetical protein
MTDGRQHLGMNRLVIDVRGTDEVLLVFAIEAAIGLEG